MNLRRVSLLSLPRQNKIGIRVGHIPLPPCPTFLMGWEPRKLGSLFYIFCIMVSLKKYTKEQILTEGNNRFKKIASMLDKEDIEDGITQKEWEKLCGGSDKQETTDADDDLPF